MYNLAKKVIALTIGTLFLWSCASKEEDSTQKILHVVVIGVDGMSPDGIEKANTPMLDSMIKNGAATMHARAVLPSSSSPNWASMIMGADTEQHGITSNGWEKFDHRLPPVVSTRQGTFPTIFTLFKDQKPEAHIGAIYDWDGFGRLFEKTEVDFDIDGDHEDGTTTDVVAYIKEHKPTFTFIHLDHVDHAGHSMGHGTPRYYRSVEKADSLIAEIVGSTKDAEMFDNTMFLIASDHGGLGYGHGGESPAEMNIPFILYGAGIKSGYQIEENVYQFDNAATVAHAMGLKMPQAWIGRPIKGAFLGNEKPVLTYKRKEQMMPPKILPDAGYFEPAGGIFKADSVPVVMQNPNTKGEMRYILTDSVPTLDNSRQYQDTFYLKKTSVLKAAVFEEGHIVSTVADANFRIVPPSRANTVKYSIYYGENMDKLPDFSALYPVQEGYVTEFSHKTLIHDETKVDQIALVLESYLEIESEGRYGFFTNSDDGSKLFVNGELLVDNDGDHGVRERGEGITLEKGRHLIRVEYFNGGGGYHLDVKYQGKDIAKQIVPANHLYPKK